MFDRKQQKSVKQLYFNQKINKLFKKRLPVIEALHQATMALFYGSTMPSWEQPE